MRVVIVKGMASTLEFDQFTMVFFLPVSLGKFCDYLYGKKAIILAMVEHAGRKTCLWHIFRGAEFFGFIIRNKARSADTFAGGVDKGTEKKKSTGSKVLSGFLSNFREGCTTQGKVGS